MTAPGTGGPAEDAQVRRCGEPGVPDFADLYPRCTLPVGHAGLHGDEDGTRWKVAPEDAQTRDGLLALYDEVVGPRNDDDLDEYLAEKRDEPEFVVAYIRAHIAALSPAAGSEDGGEALRREVERVCDEADQRRHTNHLVHTDLLRAALSAAAVREHREDEHDWYDVDTETVQGTACRRCGRALPLGQREDGPCIPAPVDRATAPVGGRSQDEQERPVPLEPRPSAEVMAGIERIANAANLPPDVRVRYEDDE